MRDAGRWRRIGVRQLKPEDGSWGVVTPSQVRRVGGADAEAMPVGIGGDEGVAEGELGGFQGHGEAELAPGAVKAVDVVSGGGEATWDAFRVALWTFPVLTLLGIFAMLHARGKTRNRMAAEEGVVVAPLWLALARRLRRGGRSRE